MCPNATQFFRYSSTEHPITYGIPRNLGVHSPLPNAIIIVIVVLLRLNQTSLDSSMTFH